MVSIGVYADGYWNMILERKDGRTYLRSQDHDLKDGQFVNLDNLFDVSIMEVEGWMWDHFMKEVEELKVAWDRDALFTPDVKYASA